MIVRTSRLVGYVKSPWRVYCFIGKSVTHFLISCDLHMWFRGWWSFPWKLLPLEISNSQGPGSQCRRGRCLNSCVLMTPLRTYSDMFRHFKALFVEQNRGTRWWWFQFLFKVSPRSLGKWSNLTSTCFERVGWNHQPGKGSVFFCWISDLYFGWSFQRSTDGRSWPPPFLRDKKSTLWEFLESRPGIEAGYGIELSASRRKNGRLGKRLTHWGMFTGVMYLSAEGFVGGLKSHKEWNIVKSFFFWASLLCCC